MRFKINQSMLFDWAFFGRIDTVFLDCCEILFLILSFDLDPFFSNLPINCLDSSDFFHKEMSFWYSVKLNETWLLYLFFLHQYY